MRYSWDEERDGPLTESAVRQRLQHMGYRVSRYDYPPGTCFPPHTHNVDKIDVVMGGRFRLEMAGESVVLQRGEWIEVPAGALHSAEVVGDETVISLDAVKV